MISDVFHANPFTLTILCCSDHIWHSCSADTAHVLLLQSGFSSFLCEPQSFLLYSFLIICMLCICFLNFLFYWNTHPMKPVSLACPHCHWICPSMFLWVSFFLWTLYYSENSSVKVSLSELQSNDLKIHSSSTYKVCQLWLHSVAFHILFLMLNKTHTGHNVSFCFL